MSLLSSERKEGKKEKGQTGRKEGETGSNEGKDGEWIVANIYRMTICQVVCTFLFNPSNYSVR